MSNSIRKNLMQACRSAIEEISVINGYRCDVPASHVYAGSGIPTEFPSLNIMWGAEKPEPTAHDLLTFRLGCVIECWVDEQEGSPHDALEDLLADVRQAIQANTAMWALLIELVDLGASAVVISDADPTRGQCALNLEMVYRHQRSNPSLP